MIESNSDRSSCSSPHTSSMKASSTAAVEPVRASSVVGTRLTTALRR
jgi:hypothetical protein